MKQFLSVIWLIAFTCVGLAQGNLELYKGNKAYADGNFDKAEQAYKESLKKQPNRYEPNYNLGNALYKKQDLENALKHYQQALAAEKNPVKQARVYHNIGNTYLENQKIDEAITAYKQALRLNPADDETRYNLAYAQRLKRQQQQQENQQDQEKDQENQQDQDNQNQDQKDQNEKQDEKGEEEKKDNQTNDGQNKKPEEGDEKPEGGESKPERELEISPREAEQMLEAAKNEDQKTLMQLKKQKGEPKKIDKDW